MSEKAKTTRIDRIIIVGVALVFIIWAVAKCTGGKKAGGSSQNPDSNNSGQQVDPGSIPTKIPLYCVVDSLKIRTGPYLDSAIVDYLLDDELVFFTGKQSEFKQQIRINGQVENAPWVQILTNSDKVGWVYGGGLSYYK